MNDFSHTIKNILKGNNNLNKLLVINVFVFLLMGILLLLSYLFQSPSFSFFISELQNKLALPATFSDFIVQPWSLFTYMFMHSSTDIFHIIFNMLWLYWMGGLLQEYLGTKKLLQIYIWGGISGGIMFLLSYNLIPVFADTTYFKTSVVGASGAVLAVMTAIATLIPSYELRLFLFGRVQLKWIAIFMIAIDFLMIRGSNAGGHITHLGGALFGFLFVYHLKNRTIVGDFIIAISKKTKSVFSFKKKPKVVLRKSTTVYYKYEMEDEEPNQEIVDEILDKISQSGYGSLTDKEKNILFKASKQL